tara:strand:+ start:45 stop:563 length:519 start_codon:yes stop_codon:yes gene_type:complete
MAFTEQEKQKLRERHAAFKKARKEGKLNEYHANKKKAQDKTDNKRKQTLKDRNKLFKTDRKEYNKQKDKHKTKRATAIYESAQKKGDKWEKENKRGKYSDRAKTKKKAETEKLYGKGLARTGGQIKRFLTGGNKGIGASKAVKEQYNKNRKSEALKIKRKKRAIDRIKGTLN